MRHADSINVKDLDESPDEKSKAKHNESYTSREPTREGDFSNDSKRDHDDIRNHLLKDLRSITDWIHDQKAQIPKNIANKNKMIELNLKINNLINENSLLQILKEKHKIIVAKYR